MLPTAASSQFVLRCHGRFLVKSEVWVYYALNSGCPLDWIYKRCALDQAQEGAATNTWTPPRKKLEYPKLNYSFECAASNNATIIDGGILTFIDLGKKNDNP